MPTLFTMSSIVMFDLLAFLISLLVVVVLYFVYKYLTTNCTCFSEGFGNVNPLNSFDKTNKMNVYKNLTDPYDNNFYSNTEGYLNPMDRGQYVGLVENKKTD